MTYINKSFPEINSAACTRTDDDFARAAAADAFGRHYVHPLDRDFKDRTPPNWQKLGDVASRVLSESAARMALHRVLHRKGEPEPLTVWKAGFAEWENKLAFAPTKLSVCTGQPGHGKSTLMTEIWFRIARAYGITVCMASFETQAKPDHRRNIRSFMFGKLEKDLADEQKAKADAWNDKHFCWLVHPDSRPDLKWIIDMAGAAVDRHNARAIVIDPWNGIHHDIPDGMRETDYVGQALDQLMDFARAARVHVQIIAHPAKSYSPEQRRNPPALEDIAGSKHWDNKPDQGFCVYRPTMFKDGQRQTAAELHVLKCRYPDLGYRDRQSEGRVCLQLELSRKETDRLCEVGLLELHQLENRRAIVEAIYKLIELGPLSQDRFPAWDGNRTWSDGNGSR